MAKNLVLDPILAPLNQIQAKKKKKKFFSPKIWLCQSLDIMVSYHDMQHQKKNDLILRKVSD